MKALVKVIGGYRTADYKWFIQEYEEKYIVHNADTDEKKFVDTYEEAVKYIMAKGE